MAARFPTLTEICEALSARTLDVAERYAPGGRVDKGKYWALNPARADRKIGSFYVNLTGPYAGRFVDHASGDGGDMLDLIQLALSCDRREALSEARVFLGMDNETPEQAALRKRREAQAKARRREAERRAEADLRKKQGRQHALFISAQANLEGTPVAGYLAARMIGLDVLPRPPGAIRYLPAARYFYTDPETGEYIERELPAMITAIYGPAKVEGPPDFYGNHITYLEQDAGGVWGKADVPSPKRFFGRVKGGYIRLWNGIGPRGGKGRPLSMSSVGGHVYVTEGIEDGLSMVVINPAARVLVAGSLGNIKEMVLPPAITGVTIIADNDEGAAQMGLIEAAVATFRNQGRTAAIWHNHHGGKDLNDALIRFSVQRTQGSA